jgi:5-methylcytosine-specific restriction endonuclease McrA
MLNSNLNSRLNSSVLVLNRSFLPIHVTSARRAFSLIYCGGAHAVDTSYQTFDFGAWLLQPAPQDADLIGTVSGGVPIPRVILLKHYDRVPKRQIRFSRLNIFSRDRFTCQYCGRNPQRSELNLDHVVPRSQGGRTTWENVVCCCVSCNRRKGGRTPAQAGFRLPRKPVRPRWTPLLSVAPSKVRYREWRPFLIPNESSPSSTDNAENSGNSGDSTLEVAV